MIIPYFSAEIVDFPLPFKGDCQRLVSLGTVVTIMVDKKTGLGIIKYGFYMVLHNP